MSLHDQIMKENISFSLLANSSPLLSVQYFPCFPRGRWHFLRETLPETFSFGLLTWPQLSIFVGHNFQSNRNFM